MRMLGTMAVGIGLILALVIHTASHIIPIGLLVGFLILSTPKGFCNQKPRVQKPMKSGGNWMRMGRGGC